MPASPAQVAALVHKPREEVRTVLQALATLGTIHHPSSGLYRHRQPGEALQRTPRRGSREERHQARDQARADAARPSTQYAAQTAALFQSEEERG